MNRGSELFRKGRAALDSGTFSERTRRYFASQVRRVAEPLIGSLSSFDEPRLDLAGGFADHRGDPSHWRSRDDHLHRIVRAYKLAKEAPGGASGPFEIRGIWAEYISLNYAPLVAATNCEDFPALSALLENHYRERFASGTGGYDLIARYRSILGPTYIRYIWGRYRDSLRDLGHDIGSLTFPMIGNPAGVLLNNNQVISFETLRHASHAVEIRELLRDVQAPSVVEIGGGLGGQCYQTLQTAEIAQYRIYDIPEVAIVSSYFLLAAFPHKRVRLFGETGEFDIAVLPHFAVTQLDEASVDLFYNSCSFSEMDGTSAKAYVTVAERACRRYFMHDNHDTSFVFRNPDGSLSANAIGSELIPDPGKYKRIYKKPRVHGLPEDRPFVHFEYLYERRRCSAGGP